MRYLGGKSRLGKHIAAKILEIVPPEHRLEYLEPFLGGAGAFEHIAPHFEQTYAGDVHEDLILMWQAVARGWDPPLDVTPEQHRELRHAEPGALRAFVGFGCSFGGCWFGGYARSNNPMPKGLTGASVEIQQSYHAALRARPVLARAKTLTRVSFFDWPVVPGVVLYCDPPYAGTYGYKGVQEFDSRAFWQRANEWAAAGSYVFVSEESAPDDWAVVWAREQQAQVQAKGIRLERLFFKGPQRWAEDVAKVA